MKTLSNNSHLDDVISVCGGTPHGDELPQVAGTEDIVVDIYSDMLNVPRDYASACYHHQYDDAYDIFARIH